MRIAVDEFASLDLDEGTYDWREFQLEFDVGEATDPNLTVVPLNLQIICRGPGEVYLDDLQATVTRK
jgi:hypothetical protein